MKVFKVSRKANGWCEDYEMIIVAEDAFHAERKARWSSDDFKKEKHIDIVEIDLDEEQCLCTANTGA